MGKEQLFPGAGLISPILKGRGGGPGAGFSAGFPILDRVWRAY